MKVPCKYSAQKMMVCKVLNSSFDVIEGNLLRHGLAVVVDRQLAGRGRSGNKWLSPEGCAMFSLQLEFDLNKVRSATYFLPPGKKTACQVFPFFYRAKL